MGLFVIGVRGEYVVSLVQGVFDYLWWGFFGFSLGDS